jgi:hypothetical protein
MVSPHLQEVARRMFGNNDDLAALMRRNLHRTHPLILE